MIKQKPIIVCDFCNEEVDTKNYLKIEEIERGYSQLIFNKGYSQLIFNKKEHDIETGDYCNLDCFFKNIKKTFRIENKKLEGEE